MSPFPWLDKFTHTDEHNSNVHYKCRDTREYTWRCGGKLLLKKVVKVLINMNVGKFDIREEINVGLVEKM